MKKTVWIVIGALVIIVGLAAAYFSNPALFTGDIVSPRAIRDCQKLQGAFSAAKRDNNVRKENLVKDEYIRKNCEEITGQLIDGSYPVGGVLYCRKLQNQIRDAVRAGDVVKENWMKDDYIRNGCGNMLGEWVDGSPLPRAATGPAGPPPNPVPPPERP